jgi:hypothetical protein
MQVKHICPTLGRPDDPDRLPAGAALSGLIGRQRRLELFDDFGFLVATIGLQVQAGIMRQLNGNEKHRQLCQNGTSSSVIPSTNEFALLPGAVAGVVVGLPRFGFPTVSSWLRSQ